MSKRGKTLIKLGGYTYNSTAPTVKKGDVRWRCSTHYTKGCKAYLITVGDEIVQFDETHEHNNTSYRNYICIQK